MSQHLGRMAKLMPRDTQRQVLGQRAVLSTLLAR